MGLFLIFTLTLLLSLLLQPAAIWVARNFNIFDNPHRDNIHKKPTPVLGGIAIFLSFFIVIIVAMIFGILQSCRLVNGLLVGGTLITLIGFIDDRFGMNPSLKLIGQFLAAGLFNVFAQVSLGVFHPLVEFGALVFAMVVLMNAFNILDNMDGVTGSIILVVDCFRTTGL